MKKLVILGAGTAGTTIANRLYHALDKNEWEITIVDQESTHYYQPGFLFIPFGTYEPKDVVKPKENFLPNGVKTIFAEIDWVEPENNAVHLFNKTEPLTYDYLIIATGTHPRPDETPGMLSEEWHKTVHDFYTYKGSIALANSLRHWGGGRLVIAVMEMPIKCPVAPLEFAFLADDYFRKQGIRERVEITYVTPLPGAFTKPIAEKMLSGMLKEKGIRIVSEFNTERIEPNEKLLIAYDEEEVPYDLLVTVPVNMGASYIERSGLGDELNHVPVDKHTFLSEAYDNIFALGDAAALPTSKAGSVAHFAAELFEENFIRYVNGRSLKPTFDGHANCFIESGNGKALLIDFNYDTEPLPGKFPYANLGPLPLLKESRLNHWGKLLFRWVYWNLLLKGRNMPISPRMSLVGKDTVVS